MMLIYIYIYIKIYLAVVTFQLILKNINFCNWNIAFFRLFMVLITLLFQIFLNVFHVVFKKGFFNIFRPFWNGQS